MFEQGELRGNPMGPVAHLLQKERLKSPPKSPFLENQACWAISVISEKQASFLAVVLADQF